ncbi:efflux RND transporter periplasmic adaptor subunit [Halarcobacter ebronensis]|uniref:Efflux transporter periplasmic adaptor subunit n=1 Tax=Halarcobacter ebronensis TaxID=1462615 RepID=A0A4Q1ANI4_9BACT|nr:efflux RND transporter periplasmic adaptor subunit [Halarcobacter ebronensis]QKF82273.1 RND family efflux system, membrane fusion protein [Halarcobacter ebronensis]RXK07694.1 efflux transporter periplasmic adaptor subunit [Halarcobacter ebronensis]
MKKLFIIISILVVSITNLFSIELSGTVISDNEKIISSRYMGFIKKVYVHEGDFVKKGQLLYEIDSSNIDSNKQEALLNLQIQENNLNNVKTNYERYKRLYEKDLVPKYDLEQLELKLKNIENMISIAKAKLKEVNFQYKYLKITAPNNGLIIKKSIKSGEMAMPTSPAIILSDLDSLKIKTEINESNLGKIKIGQEVNILIESIGLKTKGKIESIIPNIQNMTHSFSVKISFDKMNKKLYPGMYSKIYFELSNNE